MSPLFNHLVGEDSEVADVRFGSGTVTSINVCFAPQGKHRKP